MSKRIAIFCGGPSSEYEVSLNSTKTIFKYLDKKKYEVLIFYISKDLKVAFLEKPIFNNLKASIPFLKSLERIKKEKYFALLAGIHGEFAEDGKLQTLLEFFGILYSGSNMYGSTLAIDKYRSSIIAERIVDLKVPVSTLILSNKDFKIDGLYFPLVVKPNTLGSSVGVFIAKDKRELNQALKALEYSLHLNEMLIQEYIDDAVEISCGVLQKNNGVFIKLPPIEIKPKKSLFFDYSSKYQIGGSKEIIPPVSIPKSISDKISEISCTIHEYLGLTTYSRSDFLVKGNDIYYLETNTLPGMTSTSLLPQEAKAKGISFPKLLDFIINN